MQLTIDQFSGCLLGLALGDALGAPYEGGIVERMVWRMVGKTREGHLRWTDDTQMSLDLATSLLEENGVNQNSLVKRFSASYAWSRGYGPGTARILKRVYRGEDWNSASRSVYPNGSYGNGAAMRAPVMALFHTTDRDKLLLDTERASTVTHSHPLGIEGAIMIALATQCLLQREEVQFILNIVQQACPSPEVYDKLQIVSSWLLATSLPSVQQVVAQLGNSTTVSDSCPTALYVALRFLRQPFEEMMRFIVACGGDVDTIGAMAGALWGVANGSENLPEVNIESRDEIVMVATRLFQRSEHGESS